MPRFLLSVIQPDGPPPPPQVLARIMREVEAVNREMDEAGVMVLRAGLSSAHDAKVVRAKDGGMLITDGPFAETKEHIGGFALIDVADGDAALAWAHRIAAATTLPIEVRAASA
jgi:hypothetical protein